MHFSRIYHCYRSTPSRFFASSSFARISSWPGLGGAFLLHVSSSPQGYGSGRSPSTVFDCLVRMGCSRLPGHSCIYYRTTEPKLAHRTFFVLDPQLVHAAVDRFAGFTDGKT